MDALHQYLGRESPNRRLSRKLPWLMLCLAACWAVLSSAPLPYSGWVHRPYLQNMHEDRVTVMWSTRDNVASTVRYSTDTGYALGAAARVRTFQPAETGMGFTFYQYQADLTGLSPGTAYYYRILMGADNVTPQPETDYRFRTDGSAPYSFLLLGDSGEGTAGQRAVALQMITEKPDFVIHVGDMAEPSGTFEQLTANYFEYYFTLMQRACFFTVAGNHEYYTDAAAPYLALHSPPTETVPEPDRGRYYSFDWANTHFVALDANLLDSGFASASARMLTWLENDLANTRALWRVVFFHQTPYATQHHVDDPIDIAARNLFVPILERYGVQVVFAGHEHNYQRTKPMRAGTPVSSGLGTVYITSGGGGQGLQPLPTVIPDFLAMAEVVFHYLRVEVDASQIVIHAIDENGKEFDRATLTMPLLAPGDSVLNAASFTPSLASGELVSIFGEGLASGTSQASSLPLPTNLSGSTVTLDGKLLPLFYAAPRQINTMVPLDVLGSALLRVSSTNGVAETRITVADTAPAIFPSAVAHANGTLVSAASPARPGEAIMVYLTGLGQVDGILAVGQATPLAPLLHVLASVQVQLGNAPPVNPDFAGLTPGQVGLYQVNFVVPSNLPAGAYSLRVSAQGKLSNPVNVQLQGRAP